MKKITIQKLIDSSNIPPALVTAVVKQSGGWGDFKEHAPDIYNHGIEGGFHGWIYHNETVPFAKHNIKTILELAEQQADDSGIGLLEMIAGFGVFRNNPITPSKIFLALQSETDDSTQVYNVLAWYAAEETARAYMDLVEEND
jgi:hypothetical protein